MACDVFECSRSECCARSVPSPLPLLSSTRNSEIEIHRNLEKSMSRISVDIQFQVASSRDLRYYNIEQEIKPEQLRNESLGLSLWLTRVSQVSLSCSWPSTGREACTWRVCDGLSRQGALMTSLLKLKNGSHNFQFFMHTAHRSLHAQAQPPCLAHAISANRCLPAAKKAALLINFWKVHYASHFPLVRQKSCT